MATARYWLDHDRELLRKPRSIQFRSGVSIVIGAIFAFDLPQAALGVTQRHRMEPSSRHVELESNLASDKRAQVGLVRPADGVIQRVSLNFPGLRLGETWKRLPIAGQHLGPDGA